MPTRFSTPASDADGHPDADGAHPSGDERFALLDKSLARVRHSQDQLIELLHVAQDVFGYLSDDVLLYLARQLRLPPAQVYGVATFYQLFSFEAPGEHTCTVCTGTACFVKGADDIVRTLERDHGIAVGQTTADGRFTLRTARCLGSCGLAPVVVIDGDVQGRQTVDDTTSTVVSVLAEERDVHDQAVP